MVHIAVRNEQLVSRLIDDHVGRGTEIPRIVASLSLSLPTDLQNECAVPGEFQQM